MSSNTCVSSVAVVTLGGRLDASSTPRMEQDLAEVISSGKVRIVVNLSGASYVCSSSLRVLFLALRRVRSLGGDIALCGAPPRIKTILEVSGFDQVFEVFDTTEAAERFLADHAERG